MSLKADRIELLTDVSFFATATATRGGVASRTAPGGSGVSMDDASAVVSYAATASGALPMGVLLNDVVDLDLTRQHINWHNIRAIQFTAKHFFHYSHLLPFRPRNLYVQRHQ